MGRRKKSQGKQRPRVARLIDERMASESDYYQTSTKIPKGAVPMARLGTVTQSFPNKAETIVSGLNFDRGGAYFGDSTLFIAPTDQAIWDAIFRNGKLVLIPHIVQEIQKWLDDPPGINVEAHARINQCLKGESNTGVEILDSFGIPCLDGTVDHYVKLLGMRKHMYGIVRIRLEEEFGRPPTQQEVSNRCQQDASPRAQLLARQGENPKIKANLYNDECLVVAALFHAIASGKDTTILTGDEAVLDQFFKAVCLLSWHYVSMCMADHYAMDPLAFRSELVDNPSSDCFVGDTIRIVRKPSTMPLKYLPKAVHFALVHCMLLHSLVTRQSFNGETQMRRVLDVKYRTNGLNSDRLDGKNFHIASSVNAGEKYGDVAVIAQDVVTPSNFTEIPISALDLELSLLSRESVRRSKFVDPKQLILPERFQQ